MRPAPSLLAALSTVVVVAACGGTNSRYAGLSRDEAEDTAHKRVVRMPPPDTFPRRLVEAVKTMAPRGIEAWLVRVPYEGDSGDVCFYAWKPPEKKTRLQLDGSCRHWKY